MDRRTVAQTGDHCTIIHNGQPFSTRKSFRLLEIDRRGRSPSDYPSIREGTAEILKEVEVAASSSEGVRRVHDRKGKGRESDDVSMVDGVSTSDMSMSRANGRGNGSETGETAATHTSRQSNQGSRRSQVLDAVEGMRDTPPQAQHTA
jgi:hypothetical protein